MVSDIELKKSIADMYYAMSRFCNRESEAIKKNIDDFIVDDRKMGYELKTNDGDTYQLVLEFKKVSNIAYTLEDLDGKME